MALNHNSQSSTVSSHKNHRYKSTQTTPTLSKHKAALNDVRACSLLDGEEDNVLAEGGNDLDRRFVFLLSELVHEGVDPAGCSEQTERRNPTHEQTDVTVKHMNVR